jgi:diguanylate cyclase (GGDEF)-like protein
MSKLREGGKPTLVGKTVEVPALHADGRELPIELSLTMWRNSENRPAGFGAIIRDLSEKKAAELERRQSLERVTYLARHDTLTGLANRAHFAELLDESLAGGAPAVLCIDLDRFKAVNDLFGHATGDQLLRAVAVRLKQASDSDCRPGRLGGDEFAVIVPGPDAARRAERLAREVINRLSQPFMLDGRAGHIGASIGIAVSPTDGVEASSLLHNADLALYRAKAQGRGRLCFFEAEMDRAARERRALEADLRTALLNDEIELHYQPLASIDAGRVSGFEVLARWYHPEHGVIAPAHFIPIAEECGVIVEIGLHILRRAMQEAAGWSPLLNIAVNLSPLQVVHSDFASDVEALLKETGLAPERLELEITEGLLLRDTERALMILARLRALGVRISMDDFGTGYSSLSYFRQFPFDKVKIDQSFVREMTESRQALAIVQAIIGLGRGLGMPVVAEGVETRAQLDSLQAEGCAEVQGFFVGPPQPIEDYRHLVASKN